MQQTLLQDPQLEVLAGHHHHDVAQAEVTQQPGALLGWSRSTAASLDLLEIPSLVQLHPGQRAGVELPGPLDAHTVGGTPGEGLGEMLITNMYHVSKTPKVLSLNLVEARTVSEAAIAKVVERDASLLF